MKDGPRRELARGPEREDPPPATTALPLRIFLIVAASVAMAALILAVTRTQDASASRQPANPESSFATSAIDMPEPIAAEASVFRVRVGELAVDAEADRRGSAHPRSLATFRALRAYPGAPPRIPHGLTLDELRGTNCLNCHERGGYSPRFSAYAPVTPHPEWQACLQCHAPDDALAGTSLPGAAPDARCRQCHVPSRIAGTDRASGWRTSAWPALAASPSFAPQEIPHDLQLRGKCVACHAGPGAVAEIRTDHPDRVNCRQCHVQADDESPAPPALTPRAASQSRGTP